MLTVTASLCWFVCVPTARNVPKSRQPLTVYGPRAQDVPTFRLAGGHPWPAGARRTGLPLDSRSFLARRREAYAGVLRHRASSPRVAPNGPPRKGAACAEKAQTHLKSAISPVAAPSRCETEPSYPATGAPTPAPARRNPAAPDTIAMCRASWNIESDSPSTIGSSPSCTPGHSPTLQIHRLSRCSRGHPVCKGTVWPGWAPSPPTT